MADGFRMIRVTTGENGLERAHLGTCRSKAGGTLDSGDNGVLFAGTHRPSPTDNFID